MRRITLLSVASGVVKGTRFRTVFLLGVALMVLTSCGQWGCYDCDAPAWWPPKLTEGRFDVGDYKLYIHCTEPANWRSGSPTVVYLHGFSVRGLHGASNAVVPACRHQNYSNLFAILLTDDALLGEWPAHHLPGLL
jgi:hypothetical protein